MKTCSRCGKKLNQVNRINIGGRDYCIICFRSVGNEILNKKTKKSGKQNSNSIK